MSFSGRGRLDEGKEGKTGENCGRVSADVNSNESTLGEGKGDRGAEIKILKVDRAEDGIVGDSGVEHDVNGSEGGSGSGRGTRGGETVTARCAPHPPIHVGPQRARWAWEE